MGYSEIIKRALAATRSRSAWLFALVAGLFYLPATVGMLALMLRFLSSGASMSTPGAPADVEAVIAIMESMPWLALASLAVGLLGIPAYVLFEAGISIHTKAFLAGHPMPIRLLWTETMDAFPRAVAAYAVLYVPWFAAYALFAIATGLAARGIINNLVSRGDVVGVLAWTAVAGLMMVAVVCAALAAFFAGVFALRATVLDGSRPVAAVRWSLTVLRRAGRQIALMYGSIYLVQLAYSTIVSLLTTPVLVTLMLTAIMPVASGPVQSEAITQSYRVAATITVPFYLFMSIVAVPILLFTSSAWTVFYERLVGHPLQPAAIPEVPHA